MSDWTGGYVTEIGYIQGYYNELKPLLIRQALLSQAIEVNWPRKLRYLELGFGQGLSLNIHAAAMEGEFWGCDFNPAHAANAQAMAAASGADVRILDLSFEELAARTDLPTFDVIALHGIWTWISEANRRLIVDIARRHLAVGGVFYVSYNTTPGWSADMPLRNLLALHAEHVTGEAQGLAGRLEEALGFAQSLVDANAGYFRVNPTAVEKLKGIRGKPANYAVHEYLTADWHPMSFADMARYLTEAKLSFATTVFLLDHVNELYLTADQLKLLQGLSNPVFRETIRDYVINQQFRRDLWVKGPRPMPPLVHGDLMMSQTFTLVTAAAGVPMKTRSSTTEVALREEVYRPVIDALAHQDYAPKSLRQLCQSLPAMSSSQIFQALTVLSGMGNVMMTQSPEAVRSARPACDRLNAYLIEQAVHSGDCGFLASPVIAGGIAVDRFQQLFLRARRAGKTTPAEWVEDVAAVLEAQGQQLTKEGKLITARDEILAELTRQASAFEAIGLPLLRVLQVS